MNKYCTDPVDGGRYEDCPGHDGNKICAGSYEDHRMSEYATVDDYEWDAVSQGFYDDDPNPYHGDYSEM